MSTLPKYKIKKDDTVIVISGNDKGKQGKVLEIFPEKARLLVEGVRMVTKHIKPSSENPEGGRVQQEASIHISNVKLIDPSSGEPVKVGRKKDDDGKIRRFAKSTGEFIS